MTTQTPFGKTLTPFGKIRTPFGKILAVFFCPTAWDFSSELPEEKMQGLCRVHAGFSAKCTTGNILKSKWLSVLGAGLQSFRGKRCIVLADTGVQCLLVTNTKKVEINSMIQKKIRTFASLNEKSFSNENKNKENNPTVDVCPHPDNELLNSPDVV